MGKKYIGIFFIIITAALFLRLHNISFQSFWYDEVASVRVAQSSISDIVTGKIKDNGTPPFYFILLHYWMILFGKSELAIRLLGVLFSMCSILLLFFLLKELSFSKSDSIYALLILSLSPVHIYLSQEARAYSLLIFLWILSTYLFVKVIKQPSNRMIWVGYILSCFLAIYTHYFSFFLIGFHLFYGLLWGDTKKFKIALLFSYFIAIVLFLHWMPVFMQQLLSRSSSKVPIIKNMISLPFYFTVGRTLVWKHSPLYLIAIAFFSIVVFYLIPIFLGLKRLFSTNNFKKNILIYWLFVPIIVSILLAFKGIHLLKGRYLIVCTIPFYVIVAIGLQSLDKKMQKFIVIGITVLSISSLGNYYTKKYKPDWRSACSYIKKNAKTDDIFLLDVDYNEGVFNYYCEDYKNRIRMYGENDFILTKLVGKEKKENEWSDFTENILSHDNVWLIQCDNFVTKEKYNDLLIKKMRLAKSKSFYKIKTHLFTKNK